MKIEQVHFSHLKPAPWRATHTLKPDMKLLGMSIVDYGWTSNLIARREDGLIIDGFHRWQLAQTSRKLMKRDNGEVPVLWVEVDDIDARIMHIRLNRARGAIVPKFMSMLFRDIMRSKKYTEDELKKNLNMPIDEFTLLMDGGLLKSKNLAEYEYSKAWVPYESNGVQVHKTERPPNADG